MKTLIKKVREIDSAAAEYIETVIYPRHGLDHIKEITEMISRSDKKNKKLYPDYTPTPEADLLSSISIWSTEPQGHEYWCEIYKKLRG